MIYWLSQFSFINNALLFNRQTSYLTLLSGRMQKKNCEICGEKIWIRNTEHLLIKQWHQFKDVDHSKISKKCRNAAEWTKKFEISIKCPFCQKDKVLENRSKLWKHLTEQHNGRSPYFCQKCPKLFSISLGLKKHVHKCH